MHLEEQAKLLRATVEPVASPETAESDDQDARDERTEPSPQGLPEALWGRVLRRVRGV